jgi:hypothetical protein
MTFTFFWPKCDTKKVQKVDKKDNFYDGTWERAIQTSFCISSHLLRAGSWFALGNRWFSKAYTNVLPSRPSRLPIPFWTSHFLRGVQNGITRPLLSIISVCSHRSSSLARYFSNCFDALDRTKLRTQSNSLMILTDMQ